MQTRQRSTFREMAKNGNRRPGGRAAALRRDAEVTARAKERRLDVRREEQAAATLKSAVNRAFEQA